MRQAGAECAVEAILDTFIAEAPRRTETFSAAVRSGSASDIQASAHAFKSAAAVVGARSLAAMLLTAELAGKTAQIDDLTILEAQVREESGLVVAYLRGLRAGGLNHA